MKYWDTFRCNIGIPMRRFREKFQHEYIMEPVGVLQGFDEVDPT